MFAAERALFQRPGSLRPPRNARKRPDYAPRKRLRADPILFELLRGLLVVDVARSPAGVPPLRPQCVAVLLIEDPQ